MGVDIATYRMAVGIFDGVCRPKYRADTYKRYERYHNGSDIVLRTLACCLVMLAVMSCFYLVVMGHHLLMTSLTSVSSEHNIHVYMLYHLSCCRSVTSNSMSVTMYGGQYASYHSLMLLLSADIELNPGPTDDTNLILSAISDTKCELGQIKSDVGQIRADVGNVKSELHCLKAELISVKNELGNVQFMQTTFENRLAEIEGHMNQLQYQCDVINDDIAAVATNDEKNYDRFNIIEQQVNKIEAERLKCSLRIFGLKEAETSDKSLRTLVTEEVLGVASETEDFSEATLDDVKRVGKASPSDSRMIIATFKSVIDKLNLFKYRDQLRAKGIRLSNDLSYIQRQQLKDLKRRGLAGYFKNGKLVTYRRSMTGGDKSYQEEVGNKRNKQATARQDVVNADEGQGSIGIPRASRVKSNTR